MAAAAARSNTWQRLSQSYPESLSSMTNFKFSGQGQRQTPVADARTMVEIVMVLPGRTTAMYHKKEADIIVRYLGGDPNLVEEIAANHLRQGDLDEDDPQRLFGQTVESEAIKRKREDVILVELESRVKRARLEDIRTANEVARITLDSLRELGLPPSDRDRMLCKDMRTTAAFTQPGQGPLGNAEDDRDICLQQFCASRGKKGQEAALGKKAKRLYLEDHPGFTFPKKTIFAQGQMVEANRWTASMAKYLEHALQTL